MGEHLELEFEQARDIAFKIAEEKGRVIDKAIEYEDAFVFCDTTSTLIGDIFPFAIMKKDGGFVPFGRYIETTNSDMEEITVWDF